MTLLDNSQYIKDLNKESKLALDIPSELPKIKAKSKIQEEFVDWAQYFNNNNPIELEIGTGRTHYLFERAQVKPEHNLVGIEWKERWVKQALAKIARENIKNTYIIHANAWVLTPKLFADNSLSNVTFHFPDPWWKKRHHKRRIINDEFTNTIVQKLKKGGTILVQSDVSSLLEEYLEVLENNKSLKNLAGPNNLYPKNPMNAKSHREKKVEADGLPVFRAFFEKI